MPYALDTYTGDGLTTQYEVTFPYIQRDQVHVFVNSAELEVVTTGEPNTGQYKWEDNTHVLLGEAPTSDQTVRVLRNTPKSDQIVDWVDGSYIVADDLNTSDQQWLYSIQELLDRINEIDGDDAGSAVKEVTGVEPIEVDNTDPQLPSLSIEEIISTDDPNNLTSDTAVMSAMAANNAFATVLGNGEGYPNGLIGKVGKIRIDNVSEVYNKAFFWNGNAWVMIGVPEGPPGPPGPPPGLQDPPATATTVPLNPDGTLGLATALVSQNPDGDLKFLFGIPQGLTGPEGPQGPAGESVTYIGIVDATADAEPVDPNNGDFYINTGDGVSTWTGLTNVAYGDRLIWSESQDKWDQYAAPPADPDTLKKGDNVSELVNDAGYITAADIPPSASTLQEVLDNGNTSTTDLYIGDNGESVQLANDGRINVSQKITSAATVAEDQDTTVTTKSYVDAAVSGVDVGVTQLVAGNNITLNPASGTGQVLVSSTGGGEGTTINYNGAAAWGKFWGDTGAKAAGLNFKELTKNGVGDYTVGFETPMPSASYSVTASAIAGQNVGVTVVNAAATDFRVKVYDNSGALTDKGVCFAVHSLNALPPKGGTGTDSWAKCSSDGSILASFNVASVTKTDTGTFDVVFATPMPSKQYSIQVTTWATQYPASFYLQTASGFQVKVRNQDGTEVDAGFAFTVNATNATLPNTVTQEQIDNALSNSLSAWGSIKSDATIYGSLNVQAVSKNATGSYSITFVDPMPSADYAVVGTAAGGGSKVVILNKTATSFVAVTQEAGSGTQIDTDFDFTVAATNAIPPKGGTGADAWAQVQGAVANGPAPINASFNVSSVDRVQEGIYRVNFTTPFPNTLYAVVANEIDSSGMNANLICKTLNYTKSSVDIGVFDYTGGGGATAKDPGGISFVVHATNAQLPDTVTQEQIEAAINNPGVSAWGYVGADGTFANGLNATSTKLSDGAYEIVFDDPMPNTDYSIQITTERLDALCIEGSYYSKTENGFKVNTRAAATNADTNANFSFIVAATNAIPPRGGTGADAWAQTKGDGTLQGSFNIASVTNDDDGEFIYTFATPMPTDKYSVSATVKASGERSITYTNQTKTGFQVNTYYSTGTKASSAHSIVVHATNAQLPDTVTQEQLDAITATPTVKAFGTVDAGGTLTSAFGVSSVTRDGTNDYRARVYFTNPMESSSYVIVATLNAGEDFYNFIDAKPNNESQMTVATRESDGTPKAKPFSFIVYSV